MKLKYIRGYKSIEEDIKLCLENLDFPDFSIITGTNGSGKTHLLEAIVNQNITVSVKDIENYGPITYFNYQSFFLDGLSNTQRAKPRKVKSRRQTGSHNEFISIAKRLLSQTEAIDNLTGNQQVTKAIIEDIYDSVLDSREVSLQNIREKHLPKSLNKTTEKELDKLINNLHDFIKDIFRKEIAINRNILRDIIGKHRILKYRESYLGQNLCNNVKTYFRKKAEAQLEALESEAFDIKKYERKNGANPLVLFNQVLKSFSCNGYLFNEKFPYSNTELIRMDSEKFNELHYKPSLIAQNGVKIELESLSSGEKILLALASIIHKQIQQSPNDFISGILLLDEIDTNLHPSMIANMLKTINDIFRKEYMLKVIMVTHSPTTVALAPENSLFVMEVKNSANKRIKKTTKEEALNALTEGYATLESGIELIKLGKEKELVILTEGYNIDFIEKAIDFFAKDFKEKIYIVNQIVDKSGIDQLRSYFNFISKLPVTDKFLFVFDCDADISKFQDTNNKITVFKFDKNKESKATKGIENLFSKKLFTENFYFKKGKPDGGEQTTLDKNKFRNYMLNSGKEEDFLNFKPLIDKIKTLLDNSL